MKYKRYPITPVAKPRMTRRDKWKVRPVVAKYNDFKDRVRENCVEVPVCFAHVIFFIPMPKSWSKKKKAMMKGQPHQQVPDIDNLLKGLLDAIYDDDSVVYDIHPSKYWDDEGSIVVEIN